LQSVFEKEEKARERKRREDNQVFKISIQRLVISNLYMRMKLLVRGSGSYRKKCDEKGKHPAFFFPSIFNPILGLGSLSVDY